MRRILSTNLQINNRNPKKVHTFILTVQSNQEVEPTARDNEDHENNHAEVSGQLVEKWIAHSEDQQVLLVAV